MIETVLLGILIGLVAVLAGLVWAGIARAWRAYFGLLWAGTAAVWITALGASRALHLRKSALEAEGNPFAGMFVDSFTNMLIGIAVALSVVFGLLGLLGRWLRRRAEVSA
ncbi:MAG: hypothetical protein AAFY38_09905 [Pseudomonadota bacterium]